MLRISIKKEPLLLNLIQVGSNTSNFNPSIPSLPYSGKARKAKRRKSQSGYMNIRRSIYIIVTIYRN